MRKDIKNSRLFNELSENQRKQLFKMKRSKYLHNLDNIYYTMYLKHDTNENPSVLRFLNDLQVAKQECIKSYEDIPYNQDLFMSYKSTKGFGLCLTSLKRFDIYVAEMLPNMDTPRIIVQIRSQPLWTEENQALIFESYTVISTLLAEYGIAIKGVRENRIDYAYHTNIILNPDKFLTEDKLEENIVTDLKKYGKFGSIQGKRTLIKEYFSLGDRSSNNVFIRIYDKTKEVVDKSKKVYFFEIWYNAGLISKYDKFCLEYAFNENSYDKRFEGMLHFYLDHGEDGRLKNHIQLLLDDHTRTIDDERKMALNVCPRITTITNIEFETKRKYYYYYGTLIDELPTKVKNHHLDRIFKIIDNRKMFLNNLTKKTLYFEHRDTHELCDWWKRLISTKVDGNSWKHYLDKDYSKRLDKNRIITQAINKIGSNAVYEKKVHTGFIEDFTDLLSNINDNDKINFEINMMFNEKYVPRKGQEDCKPQFDSILLDKYTQKKKKKYQRVKRLLNDHAQKRLEELVEIEMNKCIDGQVDLDALIKQMNDEGINFVK